MNAKGRGSQPPCPAPKVMEVRTGYKRLGYTPRQLSEYYHLTIREVVKCLRYDEPVVKDWLAMRKEYQRTGATLDDLVAKYGYNRYATWFVVTDCGTWSKKA